jgi:hypothetical protein
MGVMSDTYKIPSKVWGTHGRVAYEYAPGKVTPKDAAEERILAHLVSIGRAEVVVTAARSKKKEA